MKNDISDRIQKLNAEYLESNPGYVIDILESYFEQSMLSLERKFPFYDISTWEAANFVKSYSFDNLAESQQKIIIEMDAVFISIYEGRLNA